MRARKWSIRIDKLTKSIEEKDTTKSFDTEIYELKESDLKLVSKKNGWNFNWSTEFKDPNKKVYKLTIKNDLIIQGLISIENRQDHLYLPLIESAPHNFGKSKRYLGVAGNLTAFACRQSFELGYDGIVVFTAKTKLILHYKKTFGAEILAGQRMVISSLPARNLVSLYFKDFEI